jgi:hypothetical protein
MTADRRLTAVETSLGPGELVRHVLAEALAFGSLEGYTRFMIGQPEEAAPLGRIATGTEASVRASMKGQPRDLVEDAVRRAVGDGMFAFILVLRINEAAFEIAQLEGLRASAAFFWMGALFSGPDEEDLEPAEWAEHTREHASAWQTWRAVVAGLLATLTVEEDARAELEARYLGGQASLFADAETEWSRFAELVDSLWSLSEKLVPLSPAEEQQASKDGERLFDERVRARAHKLADDARISTFDRLGEQRRALAILGRRLG